MEKNINILVENFQDWLHNVQNQSFLFLYHVTFSYLLSFHLYTGAIRKNHSANAMGTRIQSAPLFYSFHHPKYQQLHLRDLWQRVQMPERLKSFIENNKSFSLSGKLNAGQGCDFIHEELSKRVKSFLPPIMPTPDVWRRVCRKLKELEEIKESTIATVPTTKNFKNFDNKITMLLHSEIRSSGILNFVQSFSTIKSIDRKDLDSSLAEVKYIAKSNYENYKNNFFEIGMYNAKILQPTFVTNEE